MTYPGYQRFFLARNERKYFASMPETAHEKPLAPRVGVTWPQRDFSLGSISASLSCLVYVRSSPPSGKECWLLSRGEGGGGCWLLGIKII